MSQLFDMTNFYYDNCMNQFSDFCFHCQLDLEILLIIWCYKEMHNLLMHESW
jgi:hypothetical protein